mmetsp:Transcript_11508/g.16275  ORF Transcript_11508/g.16275 Transcript_11508/m.16275 type:complete len:87 (-) Transcript_11508:336-596(-)
MESWRKNLRKSFWIPCQMLNFVGWRIVGTFLTSNSQMKLQKSFQLFLRSNKFESASIESDVSYNSLILGAGGLAGVAAVAGVVLGS